MNDTEAYALITKILRKHDDSINEDDGGERPFNEDGECLEALYAVIDGDVEKPRRDGWI